MKLSIWDKLSLSVTGRLPKSTQAKVDAEVKKELAAKLPKDGDGDGKIFDGTKNEKPAPKKAAPKAKAPAKKPAAKKPVATKKPAAKKPAATKKKK